MARKADAILAIILYALVCVPHAAIVSFIFYAPISLSSSLFAARITTVRLIADPGGSSVLRTNECIKLHFGVQKTCSFVAYIAAPLNHEHFIYTKPRDRRATFPYTMRPLQNIDARAAKGCSH